MVLLVVTHATVTCYVGDTINFNLSNVSSIHPFYIRVSSQGSNVTTPTASGQGSTGTATVSWTPNTAGTYYYQCGITFWYDRNYHSSNALAVVVV